MATDARDVEENLKLDENLLAGRSALLITQLYKLLTLPPTQLSHKAVRWFRSSRQE